MSPQQPSSLHHLRVAPLHVVVPAPFLLILQFFLVFWLSPLLSQAVTLRRQPLCSLCSSSLSPGCRRCSVRR
ncbi:unnamed protein product [Ixodes persulcatus]